ncbi:MAG: iron export ABC transporter permease subunit FetB [Myxococcota bacterium]|nr:iron export ABC transporter permease subunit FetB [Myxococcota bacterium]
MNTIALTPLDLSLAALLVIALAVVSAFLRLQVSKSILVAGVRTAVQLLLVGLVLEVLFSNVNLVWIACIAGVMLAVATREVQSRQKRGLVGVWGWGVGGLSMLLSSFVVTLFALLLIVEPTPWYDPRYAIPMFGMMTGNTMTGVALALDRISEGAWSQRGQIEAQLSLGRSSQEAIAPIKREAARTGLVPIINAMAAAGLVSLPGMMTGQILAGNPPEEAVKYQVLIMFMIASGTGFGVVFATQIGAGRLFDERSRLRLDRLRAARS